MAAAAAVAAAQPVAAFGGHKGGGKRRADGLPAGSEEAKAADRAKDAERKRQARAKAAPLPAPLPAGPAATAAVPVGAVDAVEPAGAGAGAGASPLDRATGVLVAWSGQLLTRPAKLLTRILDRLRCAQLQKKVAASPLPEPVKKEIDDSLAFTEAAKADFAASLANATAIELNKRSVGGAKNSHLLDVLLCGGELTAQHFDTMDRIEKAGATYLAAMEKAKEPTAASGQQSANAKPEKN